MYVSIPALGCDVVSTKRSPYHGSLQDIAVVNGSHSGVAGSRVNNQSGGSPIGKSEIKIPNFW